MHHPRYVLPSSELRGASASNELGILLSENAELRRIVTELMLETALLRETLAIGNHGDTTHPDRPPLDAPSRNLRKR